MRKHNHDNSKTKILFTLACSGLSCLRVSLTGCSAAWGGMTTLTNQKTVFSVMTNQKTVFSVMTNQNTVFSVMTNESQVLPDPGPPGPGPGSAPGVHQEADQEVSLLRPGPRV